jgi:hypothetical protein
MTLVGKAPSCTVPLCQARIPVCFIPFNFDFDQITLVDSTCIFSGFTYEQPFSGFTYEEPFYQK